MKIAEGFKMRPLGRDFIILAEGRKQVDFNKMVSLNSSAAYLWQSVQGKDFDAGTLADLLVGKYDIDRETALKDSEAILSKWQETGLVVD